MSKLVAYFSASGVTRKMAEALACVEQADLFEIVPETLYTKEDLDYTNKQSRSTLEMSNLNARPAIASKVEEMSKYDIIFVGFPVWWNRTPSIIDTFLESYCLCGKTIIPFCTSGGNDISGATARIKEVTKGNVKVEDGLRLGGDVNEADLKLWAEKLGL